MTRLIDADALKESLRLDLLIKGELNYDEVIDLIANAPTVQRDGWVSVEERLPEYEQAKQRRVRVLVTWKETNAVFTLWYGHRL